MYGNQGRIYGFDIRDSGAFDPIDPCKNNIVSIGGACGDPSDGFVEPP